MKRGYCVVCRRVVAAQDPERMDSDDGVGHRPCVMRGRKQLVLNRVDAFLSEHGHVERQATLRVLSRQIHGSHNELVQLISHVLSGISKRSRRRVATMASFELLVSGIPEVPSTLIIEKLKRRYESSLRGEGSIRLVPQVASLVL